MIYRFAKDLLLNYQEVARFLNDEEELTKKELLERCGGEISLDVLKSIKALIFDKIGKTPLGEIYLL